MSDLPDAVVKNSLTTDSAASLPDRLRAACDGHPHAQIPWPHRLLHEAATELTRLRALNKELVEAGTALSNFAFSTLRAGNPAAGAYLNSLLSDFRAALSKAQEG